MWLYVYFDLPTTSKLERKAYTKFRKALISDGFTMVQYSIYARHCFSLEHVNKHMRRVEAHLPKAGKVSMMRITDKQFGQTQNYFGKRRLVTKNPPIQQLELFI
jgi:CRISPR-associated protein Cas2